MTRDEAVRVAREWVDRMEREAPENDVVMFAAYQRAEGDGDGMVIGNGLSILNMARALFSSLSSIGKGE